jgi:uncharacterized membrane protein
MAEKFFSEAEKKRIVEAIRKAELSTSGEIKVHIERTCKGDVLDRAVEVFGMLNMHKTMQSNGVLFYLAVSDHKFAILGDKGLNECVPNDFWNQIKDHMQQLFRDGQFAQGLEEGILKAGDALKTYFPYSDDDINELPDDLSFGPN